MGGGTSPCGDPVVVASLPNVASSPHYPLSSIATSPDRRHAVVAGKDALRVLSVSSHGLSEVRSLRISQYFQAAAAAAAPAAAAGAGEQHQRGGGGGGGGGTPGQRTYGDVRDTFGLPKGQNAAAAATLGAAGGANVTVNDVAWSLPQSGYDAGVGGGGGGLGSTDAAMKLSERGLVGGSSSSEQQQQQQPGTVASVPLSSGDLTESGVGGGGGMGGAVPSAVLVDPFDNPKWAGVPDYDGITTDGAIGDDSLVAAAGSNGVVVVWQAQSALLGAPSSSQSVADGSGGEGAGGGGRKGGGLHFHQRGGGGGGWMDHGAQSSAAATAAAASIGQPEAVLAEHSRAVNRLAWHPTGRRPGLLLTASQDATVKLWDRRASSVSGAQQNHPPTPSQPSASHHQAGLRSWFGLSSPQSQQTSSVRSFSWYCTATFQPKSDAVRDIKWSPFNDDIFAMVTDNGSLIVYDIRVTVRPWIRIAAHAGEATTVDWHPTRKYYVATGGGRDRSVKIWDLENGLSVTKNEENIRINANSDRSSQASYDSSSENTRPSDSVGDDANTSTIGSGRSIGAYGATSSFGSTHSWGPNMKRTFSTIPSRHQKNAPVIKRHDLSIAAPVARLEWRPEASLPCPTESGSDDMVDRHDAMLAVATAPISGASAGGFGSIGLWSFHRPFMPLSVVEGHKEGAVTDFVWLDTPQSKEVKTDDDVGREVVEAMALSSPQRKPIDRLSVSMHNYPLTAESSANKGNGDWVDVANTARTWQHVLSVGRDGKCLLQSMARGERPISRVPHSTFAVANLSPFQSGFGSLQIMSVHQKVPSGIKNDFKLTGLRRDAGTSSAPGVFREDVPEEDDAGDSTFEWNPKPGGQREPEQMPELVFSVTDQGELDNFGLPLPVSGPQNDVAKIAPEVQHLSRFAESYRCRVSSDFPTKASLCVHNSIVASRLQFGALAHMWRMLASMLKGGGIDDLSTAGDVVAQTNPMAFLLLPTLKSLLLERADAGDVQTCVSICEVMGIIAPAETASAPTTLIPGLSLEIVREWYLSYIDLLQQMCLFSHASALIRSCADPFIGALNQQSTTIHESCPSCRKPLQGVTTFNETDTSNHKDAKVLTSQRTCKSCRKRVGMCFLCHEIVKGMFVWCPGCGHGGHLDHALEWFGGSASNPAQELCPTGCGHKCNLLQRVKSFPRTESLMRCMPAST